MQEDTAEKHPSLILEGDVFGLTARARQELGGGGTSMSPLELEVLVLIDAKSTVRETLARAQGLGIDNARALDALGQLAAAGRIEWCHSADSAPGYMDFFNVNGQMTPAMKSQAEARKTAAETALLLQQQGYSVSIVRRPRDKKPLDAQVPPSILVVEDEPVLAKLLRYVLEAEGFRVRNAMNRKEIEDQFRCPPIPDLVLLDVTLPDADGFQVLERIRQHPVLKTLPVVMLTARATREAVIRGLASGANGYITKPFEIPVLIKAVHAMLGLSEASDVIVNPRDPWPG